MTRGAALAIGIVLTLAALPTLPARAQQSATAAVIGPAEFEALSTGRTLGFALDGAHYGAEQYLPGRRVIWRPRGGPCVTGEWFGRGSDICFAYGASIAVQCWRFSRRGGRIQADSLSGDLNLVVSGTTDKPLACPGPDTGV